MDDRDVTRLTRLAQELVVRVRDEDPEANGRWLQANVCADDRWLLLFVLAAAVPDDRPWSELVAWTEPETRAEKRRRQWREASGRRAA